MRIIAGKYKGKKLLDFETQNKADLRPTSDRNRESLFNLICNSQTLKEQEFNIKNAVMLDCFCGTGAVGFEALSRGAKFITFIDSNNTHLNLAKQNSELLSSLESVEFTCLDLSKILTQNNKKYDLIFLDPPYKENIIETTLQNLLQANYFSKHTILIIEHHKKYIPKYTHNFKLLDRRTYGKTSFDFLLNIDKKL